jgi:hypothetical protein
MGRGASTGVAGYDTQLERAISEVMQLLEQQPITLPGFNSRPVLSPGSLPSRIDMVG